MSGESQKEFKIQYKYAEIPNEPRYIKKKKKKVIKRSNHKHHYEDCFFDPGVTLGNKKWYYKGRYCTICGHIGDMYIGGNIQLTTDEPVFKINDVLDKYVTLEGTSES